MRDAEDRIAAEARKRHAPEVFDVVAAAMQARSPTLMADLLHPEVVYAFDGMRPLIGARAVLGYWRRVFASLVDLGVNIDRQIRDGRVVLAAYEKHAVGLPCGPVRARTIAVLSLEEGLIRSWSDGFGLGPVSPEARAVFARLRADRW